MKKIDQKEVREHFLYDPDAGKLYLRNTDRHWMAGREVGTKHISGYISVSLRGNILMAHRVAWVITHGDTEMQIDHINGDRRDNRISNLRLATQSQNNQNQSASRGANRLLGAYRKDARWQAKIKANGRQICLGCFDTEEEAHAAYLEAKKKYHSHIRDS